MAPLRRIKRGVSRRAEEFIRSSPAFRRWRIDKAIDAEEVTDGSITNLQIISPADPHAQIGINAHDAPFLKICKYYRDGSYARPNVFTCEVPGGYAHVGSGTVCTRDLHAINESQMTYRMNAGPARVGHKLYRAYKWFKPRGAREVPGLCTTISNIYMAYWGHWVIDCLPRLYSLAKSSAGRHVTLVVADDLPKSWNESLEAVLPSNFELLRLPPKSWVHAETLLLASYATGRANSHMPRGFSDYVRHACFRKFGLPLENRPSERIFVSRAGTKHRRIANEPALVEMLGRYRFQSVALEKLNFREQVELMHRAEAVVVVDGSSCTDLMFAGQIKVCILYAHHEPNTHWFTAAKGLGQEHYFILGSGASTQHDDFTVDLREMEHVISDQMGLSEK